MVKNSSPEYLCQSKNLKSIKPSIQSHTLRIYQFHKKYLEISLVIYKKSIVPHEQMPDVLSETSGRVSPLL